MNSFHAKICFRRTQFRYVVKLTYKLSTGMQKSQLVT